MQNKVSSNSFDLSDLDKFSLRNDIFGVLKVSGNFDLEITVFWMNLINSENEKILELQKKWFIFTSIRDTWQWLWNCGR